MNHDVLSTVVFGAMAVAGLAASVQLIEAEVATEQAAAHASSGASAPRSLAGNAKAAASSASQPDGLAEWRWIAGTPRDLGAVPGMVVA
jgi:hypothetical protein